jgi:hypothetical protein
MAVGGLIVILGWAVTVAESTRKQSPEVLLWSVLGLGAVLFLAGVYVFWAAMTGHKLPGDVDVDLAELQDFVAVSILSDFQRIGLLLSIKDDLTSEQVDEWRHFLMAFVDDVWGQQESDSLFPTQTFETHRDGLFMLLHELKDLARRSTTTPIKAHFNGPSNDGEGNWLQYLKNNGQIGPDDDDDPTP